ncbi:Multiple organellar rna editing factor 8 protein [Thalictrum thalictroides]|uniref:Multiple organellar rna editing factor 8 protein n=1 Tax=Thalictrum thalictroides TaxID=46969 RepID=A0A7J6V7E7_THATH|nr:Multiple organellar rna editing factor 8 protein [Thalictrum thalictroides]
MAMAIVARNLFKKQNSNAFPSIFSRSFTVKPNSSSISHGVQVQRSLVAFTDEFHSFTSMINSIGLSKRSLSTHTATSSLRDQSPNWNNRPPKETILLDGCDFEHWLIVVDKPADELTRDEIIDGYIKKLAQVLGGNMEEAKQKIYSVSTRHYFAFGCLVSEEISYKIKELPGVRWVLPDSYLDVRNKDYGGEPFINGQAVPYDPKYHEEWVKNQNASKNRRDKGRPRNFERRRENMQNTRDVQPPADRNRSGMQNPGANVGSGGLPTPYVQNSGQNNSGMPAPAANMQNNVPNQGGVPVPNQGGVPAPNAGYSNNMNMGNGVPNQGGVPPRPNAGPGYSNNTNTWNGVPNYAGMPPRDAGSNVAYYNNVNMGNNVPNHGGMPPRDAGPNAGYANNTNTGNGSPNYAGIPHRDAGPNAGHINNMPPPNRDFQNWDAPNNGGTQTYQNRGGPGPMPGRGYQQNSYTSPPNGNMGNSPSGNVYQVREVPGRDLPPQVPKQNYQ